MAPYLACTRSLTFSQRGRARGASPPFLHEFAVHFPNLERLTLSWLPWTAYPPHPSTYPAMSRLLSVRSLSLHHCSFPSFCSLTYVLKSLPALSALDMRWCAWPGNFIAHETVRPRDRPSLTEIRYEDDSVFGPCGRELLHWLLYTPSRSSIRTLTLIATSVEPLSFDTAFLSAYDFTSLSSATLSMSILEHVKAGTFQLERNFSMSYPS